MKKIVAILLAAVLLMGSIAVMAETAEKTTVVFDDSLSLAVPAMAGYTMQVLNEDGLVCFILRPESGVGTIYSTVIFPTDDEEYAAITRLNDLTEEQLQQYIDSCIEEEMNDPIWQVAETGKGSKLVLINEQGAEHDYVYLYSVYCGYQICTYVDHDDGSAVTDEDIEALLAFHTELDFIETAAE